MKIMTKVNMPIIKGQLLYHVFRESEKHIVEVKVTEIIHNAFGIYVHADDSDGTGYRFAILYTNGRNDFGKKVFFTKDGAEKSIE